MTIDLKQVAERLRKVRNEQAIPHEVYGVDFSPSRLPEAAYTVKALMGTDVDLACDDWLRERDPTPLTWDILRSVGGQRNMDGWIFRSGDMSLFVVEYFGDWQYLSLRISTVGELRTLARLAGVELKESTP